MRISYVTHVAPHIAAQLYGVPHGLLEVFNTILYENEFQSPQIFHQHVRFSPEHSTLQFGSDAVVKHVEKADMDIFESTGFGSVRTRFTAAKKLKHRNNNFYTKCISILPVVQCKHC
jgi:hypothetical protein